MILCAGDMSSGFIPLKPVLDNREQLIEERLDYYLRIVPEKYSIWNERLSQHISDPSIRDNILCDIAFLVNADMISGAIPLKPVLLGRDEMIFQRFNAYVELILEKSSRFSFINGLSKSKNVEKIKESIIKIDPNKRRKGIKSRRR
ncbi:hypothetical protein DVG40_24215 [Salmonella enterica subsp. enterica serovar Inganda]|nr:hypothetical protein [Salmonella enterica subsp. enterica serovar Inganda]